APRRGARGLERARPHRASPPEPPVLGQHAHADGVGGPGLRPGRAGLVTAPYQGTEVPSQEKNPPVGPSSGRSASRTAPAAASAGSPSLAAAVALRSVRRRPVASALTLMPSSARAWA